MQFDRSQSTLVASPAEIDELEKHISSASPPPESWATAGLMLDDALHPTVTGIIEVVGRPTRSTLIEHFDGDFVTTLFVAWDQRGRATVSAGADGEQLAITATDLNLLPALLAQSLRLGASVKAGVGNTVDTTAAAVEDALTGKTDTDAGQQANALFGDVRNGWRASGSWPNQQTDTSVTVLSTKQQGLWNVKRPHSELTPDSIVTLEPLSRKTALDLLGDVITGRTAEKVEKRA